MADEETHVRKSKTLFIRNLPYTTTNEVLESFFSDIGPVKRCFVVSDKDSDKCRGFGYVTYSLLDDAEKAKNTTRTLKGRKLNIDFAGRKKDFTKNKKLKHQDNSENAEDDEKECVNTLEEEEADSSTATEKPVKREVKKSSKNKKDVTKKTEERKTDTEEETTTLRITGWPNGWSQAKVFKLLRKCKVKNIHKLKYSTKGKSKRGAVITFKSPRDAKFCMIVLKQKKAEDNTLTVSMLGKDGTAVEPKRKTSTSNRQCRLIIRNLPFKCTEQTLEEVFGKFGHVSETKIPLKPGSDGKMFGFGFVQFSDVDAAQTALTEMNMKQILGRPVAVDWAVSKDKYEKAQKAKQSKETDTSTSGDVVTSNSSEKKELSDDEGSFSADSDVQESDSSQSEEDDEESSDEDMSSDEGFEETDEDDEDEEDDDDDDDDEDEEELKTKGKNKKSLKNDVEEGKTLFIRNVLFETKEDTLKENFSEFGKVNYCRMVVNPSTGLPKGSAFVQFRNQKDAEKCLEKAGDETKGGGITIDGRKLLVSKAISKSQAQGLKQTEEKKKQKEDKRNLHLAREGLIRPGTLAAEGLTKEDLTKRTKVENLKRQKLKNPSVFISTTRLCVRNIPVSVDDKELKKVFLKAAGDKKAVVTESRIMRDLERMNSQNVAKSRGYGFVNFTDHKHALEALRTTNNNPDLFGAKRRLIVEFSLENKTALLAKEKKMDRIKTRKAALEKKQGKDQPSGKPDKAREKKEKLTDKFIGSVKTPEGLVKPKSGKVMPSHTGPKIRHKPRPTQTDSKKKDKKSNKRKRGQEMEQQHPNVAREGGDSQSPKKMRRRNRSDVVDDFDRLVNKYKNQMLSNKSKWFES